MFQKNDVVTPTVPTHIFQNQHLIDTCAPTHWIDARSIETEKPEFEEEPRQLGSMRVEPGVELTVFGQLSSVTIVVTPDRDTVGFIRTDVLREVTA